MHSVHQFQFRHLSPTGDEVVSTFRVDSDDQPIDHVVDKFFDFMSAVAGYDLREPPVTLVAFVPVEAEEPLEFPPING